MRQAHDGVSRGEARSALMVRTPSSARPALLGRLLVARARSLAVCPDVSSSTAAATLVELADGSKAALSFALAHVQCRDPARRDPVLQQAAAALVLAQATLEHGRSAAVGDDTEEQHQPNASLVRRQRVAELTAEGLNMAGVRRVLRLEEEQRALETELLRLRAGAASRHPGGGAGLRTPPPPVMRALASREGSGRPTSSLTGGE